MRDWTKAFRLASFRGVGFWVDSDRPERGRRTAVHEISGGSRPVVEDMGKRARAITVAAYVASDLADVQGRALEAACETVGPGRLVLPMDPGQAVHCVDCRRDRSKDRNGFIGYDLTFLEAGSAVASPAGGLSAVRGAFDAGLPAVVSALATGDWRTAVAGAL